MPDKDNRSEWIKARVTPNERVRAEQTAALLDLTMSDLIRVTILEGMPEKSGLSADDRNSLNLILRYLQQVQGMAASSEVMVVVLGQLTSLIRRIEETMG